MRFEFEEKKLWTTFEIIIVDNDEKNVWKNIYQIWKMVDIFEENFSRFKENSLLSKLNKEKSLDVNIEFIDIFNKSKDLYDFTNWYFNPLVNLNTIWYSSSFFNNKFEKIDYEQNLLISEIVLEWNKLTLKNNQNIDFWWIAKWYLVDKISTRLKQFWYENFLVNGWWDIYLSWLNEEWNNWWVSIESPYDENSILWWIRLSNVSVSTSWSYKRNWNIDWEKYHHILNPHTLKNDNQLVWITIISPNCYVSDSLATAIFCMWMDDWKKFLIKNWIDWILFWKIKKIFITPNFEKKYSFTLM